MVNNFANRSRPVQIGGAGEGNLPSDPLLRISSSELKAYMNSVLSQSGSFHNTAMKGLWTESLLQFSIPYYPWKTGKRKRVCRACGCDCMLAEESKKRTSTVLKSSNMDQEEFLDVKNQCEKNFKKQKGQVKNVPCTVVPKVLPTPPTHFYIPLKNDVESIYDLVSCWRYGTLANNSFTPLRLLQTAKQRISVWNDYTNEWWNASGKKCAYFRVKRLIREIAYSADPSPSIDECGEDQEWATAIQQYRKKISKNTQQTIINDNN